MRRAAKGFTSRPKPSTTHNKNLPTTTPTTKIPQPPNKQLTHDLKQPESTHPLNQPKTELPETIQTTTSQATTYMKRSHQKTNSAQ
jgi:hypothetical protein